MLPDVATLPTPLSMLAEVAFVVVHVSVADCPAVMLVGDAVSEAVGGGTAVPPPLEPLPPEPLLPPQAERSNKLSTANAVSESQ